MRKIDDGGHAFPVCFEGGANSGEQPYLHEGMSLRDWFAGQSLHQSVEDYDRKTRGMHDVKTNVLPWACEGTGSRESIIARQAYRYADAMIAARKAGE